MEGSDNQDDNNNVSNDYNYYNEYDDDDDDDNDEYHNKDYDEDDFIITDDQINRKKQQRRNRKKQRRNRQKKQSSSSSSTSLLQQHLDFTITGTKLNLYRDDVLAQNLHDEKHLINYFEDGNNDNDDDGFQTKNIFGDYDDDGYNHPIENKKYEQEEDDDEDGCFIVHNFQSIDGDCDGDDNTSRDKVNQKKSGLYMDRYDVRTLLMGEDCHIFMSSSSSNKKIINHRNNDEKDEQESKDEYLLNLERYGMLPEYRTVFLGETLDQEKDGKGDDDGDLVKNTKRIDNDSEKNEEKGDEKEVDDTLKEEDIVFTPTKDELRLLPSNMIMPQTKRQNNVIQMTAKRTCSAPQLEVLLKLKQSGNPEFGFLQTSHALNPYYLFLKGNGGMILSSSSGTAKGSGKDEDSSSSSVSGGCGGLVDYKSSSSSDNDDTDKDENNGIMGLGMYSSSDDEDDNEEEGKRLGKKIVGNSGLISPSACLENGGFLDCASSASRKDDAGKIGGKNKGGNEIMNFGMYASSNNEQDDDTHRPVSTEERHTKGGQHVNKKRNLDEIQDRDIKKEREEANQERCRDNEVTNSASNAAAVDKSHMYPASEENTDKSVEDPLKQPKKQETLASTTAISAEELKAKRLKRARLMKGHFALKMMDKK